MLGGKEITAVQNLIHSHLRCKFDSVSLTLDPGRATYNSSAKKWSLRGIMLAKIGHSGDPSSFSCSISPIIYFRILGGKMPK
ncbi:hypothetical protein CEXT_92821 [Caerostris extrusa]|uniref:Uncharacterized protein n=1 Tax=Caerostris extrusa TaxID=172846 RepID=A0AAV4NWV3_CAEEX|nr:hypothetical protein CEXT_92821 [Caerostris extrusa]